MKVRLQMIALEHIPMKILMLLLPLVIYGGCTSSVNEEHNHSKRDKGEGYVDIHRGKDSMEYQRLMGLRSSFGVVFWEGILSIRKNQKNDFWNENDWILPVAQFMDQGDGKFPLNEEQEKRFILELSSQFSKSDLKTFTQTLKYWCLGAQHFELLKEYESSSDEEILEAFYTIAPLKDMIDSRFLTHNQSLYSLSSYQILEVKREVITYISYLPAHAQLELYGQIYLALSQQG